MTGETLLEIDGLIDHGQKLDDQDIPLLIQKLVALLGEAQVASQSEQIGFCRCVINLRHS